MERQPKRMRLCDMFGNGYCKHCGVERPSNPSQDDQNNIDAIPDILPGTPPNPIPSDIWEKLLEEDAKAENMSRSDCTSPNDSNSWPLFLLNKCVENLRRFGSEAEAQPHTIYTSIPQREFMHYPAMNVQDYVPRA